MGNIVNRVFDSSGPEGKVRGTPQQIIDKYLTLARDAQLGNDRVAAENFQQHAEHYARLLGEAQREIEAQRQQSNSGGGDQRDDREDRNDRRDDRPEERRDDRREERREEWSERKRKPETAEVIETDTETEAGGGLVETPEMHGRKPDGPKAAEDEPRPRRGRRPRGEKPQEPPSPPSEAAE